MSPRICVTLLFVFLVAGQLLAVDCPTCPTADEVQVQALLDAAAANGGGVVQLEARVYTICKPLIVGSNTHLRGAGRGATIIRGSTAAVGLIVQNSYVSASIATVGSKHVTISDLTVDHLSCNRYSNGISFLPATLAEDGPESYSGTPSSHGLIERVEVLGAPQYHSYMIWNLRGQHMKILNNWVDGGATSMSYQEGIESYGGHDIVISGNTVRNVGYGCLTIGSGTLESSDAFAMTLANNFVSGCEVGINLTAAVSPGGIPQTHISTRILGNVISASRSFGIDVAVMAGTIEGDLLITNNTIRDMDGTGVAGIRLRSLSEPIDGSAVISNTVQTNHIENIHGTNAHGIRLLTYHNTRILDNTFKDIDHGGIWSSNSNDLDINGNRLEEAGLIPIQMWDTTSSGFLRFVVERNRLSDWDGLHTGILINGGRYGSVRGNVLSRTDSQKPTPIIISNSSCGVTVTDNVPWYLPTWLRTSVAACQ